MLKLGATIAVLALFSALVAIPAAAHHAFAAEYDAQRHVNLEGTVTKMEWINPHAWVHIDVKKPDGTVEQWMVEFGTPNTLLRRGFTKESLKVGQVIKVDGYGSKDGSLHANGRNVTLPDGRVLFAGNGNEGGPAGPEDPQK
jgi:hypothetical protein